jgi:3',5'-cyclic AMP phosphodiesterase CpdA
MFRLAHISDPHLGPLPPVAWQELMSKRITGYMNWQRHRGKIMAAPVLGHVISQLKAQNPDHVVVTGDLVNLGLEAEVANAGAWLGTLGQARDISVVPGNHDAYVPGALIKACRSWAPFMSGDAPPKALTPASLFPYLRVRGTIAIIGVSSAIATAPFLARGAFRPAQAKQLCKILEDCGKQGLFRVILIHHPPVRGATAISKRLFGIGLFQSVAAKYGAELVLHGHTHLPTLYHISGPDSHIPVVGVTSTSQSPGGRRPAAGYNLFEISGGKGAWSCTLERRSVTEQSGAAFAVERQMLLGSQSLTN